MFKKQSEMRSNSMEKVLGGEGVIVFEHIFEADEMESNCRTLAKGIFEPGSSIGYHIHEAEEEVYYVLSGVATVNMNGETRLIHPGEAAYLAPGGWHSVTNNEQVPLEMLVVITTV